MFTVTHHTPTGMEVIHAAESVVYRGRLSEGGPVGVEVHKENGGSFIIDDGRVYVMNDKGATVASYILGPPAAQGVAAAA